MLEFALTLLLTAGLADRMPPTDTAPASFTVTVTSVATGSASNSWSPQTPPQTPPHTHKHKVHKVQKHIHKVNSKHKRGNRPVPGPVPLALLALGVCGVGGARWRRRRKTAK